MNRAQFFEWLMNACVAALAGEFEDIEAEEDGVRFTVGTPKGSFKVGITEDNFLFDFFLGEDQEGRKK